MEILSEMDRDIRYVELEGITNNLIQNTRDRETEELKEETEANQDRGVWNLLDGKGTLKC